MTTMEAPAEAAQKIEIATDETSRAIAEAAINRLHLIQDLAAEIESQRKKLKRRETDVAKVTAERKLAMGEVTKLASGLDELHTELENLINGRDSERLPFVPKGEAKAEPATNGEAAPAPDAWRAEPVGVLVARGLPAPVCDRLVEAGLTTLGAVEDWRAADCETPKVRGFAGSGTNTRKSLDDAMEGYWTWQASQGGSPRAANGDLPSANGQAKAEVAGGFTAAYVGLPRGGVAARAHMHLLAPMQTGQVPDLKLGVVDRDGVTYVATPAPTEAGPDVYALRRLYPAADLPTDEGPFADGWQRTPGDAYVGGAVSFAGVDYRIGPVADAIFIHDPQEAK